MTDTRISWQGSALRHAWAEVVARSRALAVRVLSRPDEDSDRRRVLRTLAIRRRPLLRKLAWSLASLIAVVSGTCALVGWRLANGPISLDLITPWMVSAIEERFGGQHRVTIAGTQIERTEDGRTAVRLRDIVVSDAAGNEVAKAPKAEVSISAAALLTGTIRTERMNLIEAEMAIRLEPSGQVTISANTPKAPALASVPNTTGTIKALPKAADVSATGNGASAGAAPSAPLASAEVPNASGSTGAELFAALLAWIERLDALGLDGEALNEIGLKSGTLTIDDQRNGKLWNFANINLSLTRPKEGGVTLALSSTGADGPWSLTSTVTPLGGGRRAVEAVVRDVSPKDIMLATRMGDGEFEADMPLSAIIRAEVGPDGVPQMLEGRVLVGAGFLGDPYDRESRILIDEAQVDLRWDPASRTLAMPLEIQSGSNRMKLLAQVETPREQGAPWAVTINRGMIVLNGPDSVREPPLVFDRISLRARFDPAAKRIELERSNLRGVTAGLAFSGTLDFASGEAKLNAGLSGTRMPMSALKRIWPSFVNAKVREWILENVAAGTVEKIEMAAVSPLVNLKSSGPPVADNGLLIEIVASGVTVRPIDNLPAIQNADVTTTISGRKASIEVKRGAMDLPSGRRIALSNGLFEVPDTFPKAPPARAKFRAEGSVEAAAELIAMEPFRDAASVPFDPATARGSVVAQVSVGLPIRANLKGAVNYAIDADITNFAADRLVKNLKGEANAIKISATPNLLQVKGDARIAGTAVAIDYRKSKDADADLKVTGTLDDSARQRLGLDVGSMVSGSVPVKITSRIAAGDRESRHFVEADLTQAKLTDLFPGWQKPAGKQVKASFAVIDKGQSTRFEDVAVEGYGASIKGGVVELDSGGELISANFPVFGLSDGDKASVKLERGNDGTLRVVLRGDVYDGRGFIKSSMSGAADKAKRTGGMHDVDLDLKTGALIGHHGEALRNVDLRLSRRAGQFRSFAFSGKLGRDATLLGDLRARNGRQVVYMETDDAGALFRLADIYPRIYGGQLWVAMEPPTTDFAPQDGTLNMRDFQVRGEPALDRVVSSNYAVDPNDRGSARPMVRGGSGVEFTRLKADFTRSPGKLTIREGVVWGPAMGATVEGTLEYARNDVHMRGTFVPAYALNNMLARIPVVGFFLGGGSNEGVLGITFEVTGQPQQPTLRVNPMSAVAPGFLRKLFEFRGAEDRTAVNPNANFGR